MKCMQCDKEREVKSIGCRDDTGTCRHYIVCEQCYPLLKAEMMILGHQLPEWDQVYPKPSDKN